MSQENYSLYEDPALLEDTDLSILSSHEFDKDDVKNSGIKYLCDSVKRNFPECSFLLEYSLYSTCIQDKKVKYVSAIGSKLESCFPLKIDKANKYYRRFYNELKKENIGVYFTEKFFKLPSEPRFYFSIKRNNLWKDVDQDYSNLTQKLLADNNDKSKDSIDEHNNNQFFKISEDEDEWGYHFGNGTSPEEFKEYNPEKDDSGIIQQRSEGLHYAYDKLFCDIIDYSKYDSVLLSIPIIAPSVGRDKEKNKWEGQGALFLYLNLSKNSDFSQKKNEEQIAHIRKISVELSQRVKDLILNALFYSGRVLAAQAMKNSIKSAIAAIMSRNMSHNIGSHVLSALTFRYNMPYEDVILYRYLQHRMDFIAQITTDWPTWTYPVWFVRDMLRKFYTQTHLLNLIVESEDISAYQFQGEQASITQTSKLIIEIEKVTSESKIEKVIAIDSNDETIALNNDFDVQIAIPGGTVGYHAFYVILENIIRNSAKHDWSRRSEDNQSVDNLVITCRFYEEPGKDHVRFFIYSNIGRNDVNDFIASINERLKNRLIKDSGELNNENWGLSEIKIALGYLNRKNPLYIGNSGDNVILNIDNNETNGILIARQNEFNNRLWGYEFIVPRPKEILIVTDNKEFLKIAPKLSAHSIDVISNFNTNCDYELIIVDGQTNIKQLVSGELRAVLPFRVLTTEILNECNTVFYFDARNISNLARTKLSSAECASFKLTAYKSWVMQLLKITYPDREIFVHGETQGSSRSSGSHNDTYNIAKEKVLSKRIEKEKNAENRGLLEELRKANTKREYFNTLIGYSHYMDIVPINLEIEEEENYFITIFKKYEEDIETLPKPYRASQTYKGDGNDVFTYADSEFGDLACLSFIKDFDEFKRTINKEQKNSIYLKRHSSLSDTYLYAEALSGAQIYFNLLINGNQNPEARYLNSKVLVQVLENAFLGIIIIDERVHEFYRKSDPEVKERLDSANICILNDEEYSNSNELLIHTKELLEDEKNYKFIIIHQGVLEKIISSNNDQKFKLNARQFLNNLREVFPYVIITSGRGKPDKIPQNEKFIPYSTISETILKPYHEKFLLTNILLKLNTTT